MRLFPDALRTPASLALAAALVLAACSGDEDTPLTPQRSTKTVTIASGTGNGRITSGDGRIDCRVANGAITGPVCTAAFDSGAVATFTAAADTDQEFTAWDGDCTGTAACQLSITRHVTAAAKFAPVQRTFTLELTTPNADDGAVIVEVSGPSILAVTPAPGVEMVENRTASGAVTTAMLLLRGPLATGVIAQMTVRGVNSDSPYDTRVIQAAARASGGYAQRADLSGYRLTVRRP